MNDLRKAAKQALEALQTLHDENMDYLTRNKLGGENNQCMVFARESITALRAALKEPEQEPVAIKHMMRWVDALKRMSDNGQHMKIPGMNAGACWELAIELEQFLYTHPPQRKPLTDEEIDRIIEQHASGSDWSDAEYESAVSFARAIERAHGIKQEEA